MIDNIPESNTSLFHTKRSKTLAKEDLLQAARLVRIKLDDNEVDYYLKELEVVLNWIQAISQIDSSGITPMSHGGIDCALYLREDVVNDGDIRDIVLSEAPEQEHDFFVVPKVIE
ncbi:MAG: Asp-tRNA(Asn)/Glu-tRNA(Gln) amidotransferase subunit GatC [Ehrlichia sp.]